MKCPACGTENLPGEDGCNDCGEPLTQLDVPTPERGLQRRLLEETIRDLDPAEGIAVAPDTPLSKVLETMRDRNIGSVLVSENGNLIGIATEWDFLCKVAGTVTDLDRIPVSEIMTRNPETLSDDSSIAVAVNKMSVGGYRHLPIADEGKPVRMISVFDVFRHLT